MSTFIKNVTLLSAENLANNLQQQHDVLIDNGKIHIAPQETKADNTIDGKGFWLSPAFTDCYAHLPEMTGQWRGNIETETTAAIAGGFANVAIAPDSKPCIDSSVVAQQLIQQTHDSACQMHPIGALTEKLNGETLSSVSSLLNNGCLAVSQGMAEVPDQRTLSRAYSYASSFDALIMSVPFCHRLAGDACAAEGATAFRLGLPSMPSSVETSALAAQILLATENRARIHFPLITTAEGVALIREAKSKGLQVSAGTAIHYLQFDDTDLEGFNANYRVMPPLRSRSDREALLSAINDGTLETICSDHMPQDSAAKRAPFPSAGAGMNNLQTVFSQGLNLVNKGELNLDRLIYCLSSGPNKVLQLNDSTLDHNSEGRFALIDPKQQWQVDKETWLSAAYNTPFWKQTLTGKVLQLF